MITRPISEQSVKLGQTMDRVLPRLWLAVGAGLIAFSIWGFKVCWAIAYNPIAPRGIAMRVFVFVPSWCVLFLPFAFVGFLIIRSTLRQMRMATALRRLQDSAAAQSLSAKKPVVEILPPTPTVASSQDRGQRAGAGTAAHAGYSQPSRVGGIAQRTGQAGVLLDEVTKRRMDELGVRAAKITGIVIGLFFLVAGLFGFVAAWIHAHRPPDPYYSIHSELASFRLTVFFLAGCGLAVAIGGIILRATFKQPETGWLGPLHAFTAVISRRVVVQDGPNRRKNGDS